MAIQADAVRLSRTIRIDRAAIEHEVRIPFTCAPIFAGIVCPKSVASPTGVVREWTREVPGEVKAA